MKSLYTILILLGAVIALPAQDAVIRLLDRTTQLPIEGATFEYAQQNGLSDAEGRIAFTFAEGETMRLSHTSYGAWTLSAKQLKAAMQAGFTLREEIWVNLTPATIIAMRPKLDEKETLDLDYQDKVAHDAGAILSQTAGIGAIRKSGSYGFDPVIRGFKYDQLNVVINGVQCATAACPNRMDPPTSQIAPNMTDRIEILKGPYSLRYGSSFGATINVAPVQPRFSENTDVYGRLTGQYESNGGVLRSEGLIGMSGKRYDAGLFASWSQGNDYTDGEGMTIPADFLRGSFGANLGLKLAENQQLSLSATRNLARDTDFPALMMDLRTDDTWMFNASHQLRANGERLQQWNTTAYANFVDHLMDNLLKPLDPRMMNASNDAKTRTYGGRTEGTWQYGKSKLYAGADFRMETAEGIRVREFLMGPNAGKIFYDNAWQSGQISRTGLFAEYQWRPGSLLVVFSGRLEMNHSMVNDAAEEFLAVYPDPEVMQFNPSFSLGGIRNLDNGLSLGLWLGRGQRSGSITERFINYFPVGQDPYEMLGNPEIKPEVNNQADLTFTFRRNHSASVSLDLFAAYLQDYITGVVDPSLMPRIMTSPGVRRYVNIGQAFKTGFELSWSQKLFAGLQHHLSAAYTYGQDLERGEALPEIPPLDFRYTLSGSYLKNKLRPEATLRHVLAQNRISEEFGETKTPSFTLLDAQVSYQALGFLNLRAGVQNLLDAAYYEHLNRFVATMARPIYAPGRNWFVGVTVDWR